MIWPASVEHAEAMARLRFEFRAAEEPPTTTAEVFLARCVPWMAARLSVPSVWRAWFAEVGGEAIGTVWLQVVEKLPNPVAEPEWHGYVSSLYVRESERGAGVGSRLLQAALEACDARTFDAVMLWPTPRSRSLYLRHGFAVRDDLMSRRRT